MKRVPGSLGVNRAFKAAARQVKTSLKRVNQQAARLLARGDYAGAEELVAMGRAVSEFLVELEALGRRWRKLRRETGSGAVPKAEATPTWKYYTPILQAVAANGGAATWREVQEQLESRTPLQHLPADLQLQRGKPRWLHAIYRARGGLVREGFIEKRGKQWRITTAGRQAAETGSKKAQG